MLLQESLQFHTSYCKTRSAVSCNILQVTDYCLLQLIARQPSVSYSILQSAACSFLILYEYQSTVSCTLLQCTVCSLHFHEKFSYSHFLLKNCCCLHWLLSDAQFCCHISCGNISRTKTGKDAKQFNYLSFILWLKMNTVNLDSSEGRKFLNLNSWV